MLKARNQPLPNSIKIGDLLKRLPLAPLGALAVAGVDQCQAVLLVCDGRGDARVHATTQQNNRLGFLSQLSTLSFCLLPFALAPQTPRIAGSQINLCNCSPNRTGKPSARIHSLSSRALIPGHEPSGSFTTGEKIT